MIFSLMFSFACNTEPTAPSAKEQVITVNKHAVAKVDDFQTKSFRCCTDENLTALLLSYLTFTKSLAADKGEAALPQAKQFLSLASNFPTLKQDSDDLKLLWDSADGIQSNLNEISVKLIELAKNQKQEKGTEIIVAFCPMAPGRWLQTEKTISNPYYGSKMLTCGVFE